MEPPVTVPVSVSVTAMAVCMRQVPKAAHCLPAPFTVSLAWPSMAMTMMVMMQATGVMQGQCLLPITSIWHTPLKQENIHSVTVPRDRGSK